MMMEYDPGPGVVLSLTASAAHHRFLPTHLRSSAPLSPLCFGFQHCFKFSPDIFAHHTTQQKAQMSHNYQIYGGIAEEEFVDVPDQDFVEANYEAAHPEHFSTTDVQYAQPQDGKMSTEDQHHAYGHEQPEEVYYDGDEGLAKQPVDNSEVKNNGHTEKCLLEAVEQMNIETEQRQFPEEGQPQNNGDNSFAFDEQVPIEHAAMGTGVQDEDPSTPTALVPPTTPKAKNARTLSDIMAAETQYPIPYRSKLTEQFEPGQTLIVKGKTAEDSVRFTINLHHASADFSGNDVPLHVSVRFDEGKIVFNTFSKGEWGKEERKSNPYKKGDDIDIRIRAHDSKFTIYADQKEIKEYEHRVPLSSISHFSIDGDILITHIHWGGKYYPVPYESGITGDGFGPGKTMLIFGTAEKKGKRFHINLLKKNGDIALHFNPRFDEKAIVRNSLIANEWGNEEREGKIPLEKGIGFDLKIVNEEYAFQIFLNDERFCSYAHRMEPHDIHGLQIGGDVEITGIQIF